MKKLIDSWRYYTYGMEQFRECMNSIFINNLLSLHQANMIVAVFAGGFSLFPIVAGRDFLKAGIFLAVALIAFLLSLWANYKMQTAYVNNTFIYILTILFYANLMLFTIYLSVWSYPEQLASVFYCFFICAMLMFVNPPIFNLCLTLGGMLAFIASVIIKAPLHSLIFDIVNVLLAAVVSLYFSWYITKLRLGLELSAGELEEERNKYFDQSILDELTQLRNRRDFMATFQRYLVNYRTNDDYLCLSIMDIDFFKFFNDHYGHPMGDECLRGVGRVLNGLKDSLGVYTARVGGEEFAMLWFEKDVSHVDEVVRYLQKALADLKMPHEKSKVAPYVTLSIGVYIEKCGASNDTKIVYGLADQALYSAKEGGRNCAIITGGEIKQYKIKPADS